MSVLQPPKRSLPVSARSPAPGASAKSPAAGAAGGESSIANPIKISRPADGSNTQIVETNTCTVNVLGQVMVTGGGLYQVTELGSWTSGNPKQARTIRVVAMPLRDNSWQEMTTFQAPNLGAMVLVREFGEQGAPLSHWLPVPCDMTFCAVRVQVYTLGVGLPYQAIPQSTPVANTTLTANVQLSFSEQPSFLWPSAKLYPARTLTTLGGPTMPASGVSPLFPYRTGGVAEYGCAGFLRGLKVTNTTSTGVLVNVWDAPGQSTAASGPTVYPFVQTVPFYAPSGQTVLETFDDLPFFWGPWAGISTTPGGAWTSGTGILLEADYVALQPPGT